jgi:anti-anti-sigma factor
MSRSFKIVQPSGILDSTHATQLRQEISQIVGAQVEIVLLDLKDVSFVDSAGLGALVSALKTVRSAKAELYLCSITDQVKMLFELTHMDRVFNILADQNAFTQLLQISD